QASVQQAAPWDEAAGMERADRFGRLSLRYTTRSCVIAPPRWWRAWNYSRAHHLLSLPAILADRSWRDNADDRGQRPEGRRLRGRPAAPAAGDRLVRQERQCG